MGSVKYFLQNGGLVDEYVHCRQTNILDKLRLKTKNYSLISLFYIFEKVHTFLEMWFVHSQ